MFEKIRKMKNQKGFTLVELIVVLVILAILAAMLVPALTGYIDKANQEKVIATTRQVVMAAQTEVSEAYASKPLKTTTITINPASTSDKISYGTGAGTESDVSGKNIVKLAEVGKFNSTSKAFEGLKNNISKIEITYTDKGHVETVKVTQGAKICTYNENGVTGDHAYISGNYCVDAT